MDTTIPRPRRARRLGVATLFAALAIALPALAGVALACATTSVSTTLSATSPVAIGTTVHDTATISGAHSTAGGTIAYKLYSNNSCSTSALVADLTPTTPNNAVTNGISGTQKFYRLSQ